MEGCNGTVLGGEAICRVCCIWLALGSVDVVTKTSLCSAIFRCWPSALRLTCFGNMDEEMKTWACLKVLNLKMADLGEGFWVQACRSCKKSLVFTSKLLWNTVKVFLPLQPLLTHTENSPCLKCQEKQELTNKPEDRLSLSEVTSSFTPAISLHHVANLAPLGQPAVLTSHRLASCAFITVCWLLAFHLWAYLLSCKRLPASTPAVTHLHCKCLRSVILKMRLRKTAFLCCLMIRHQVMGESLVWCYCSLWF